MAFSRIIVFVVAFARCAYAYTLPCQSDNLPAENQDLNAKGTFRGLTLSEFSQIRDFVFNQTSLHAEPSASATLNSNYIFLIEDLLPEKARILTFRDNVTGVPATDRRAKVVMFMGAERPKVVREYIVSPIPSPHTIQPIGQPVSWKSRPLCPTVEQAAILRYLDQTLPLVKRLLFESFGQWVGDRCSEASSDGSRCLFPEILPRAVPVSIDRHLQVLFYVSPESVDGYYLYPVPFTLVLYTPNNGDQYAVHCVYYNGVRFSSLQSLCAAYNQGKVSKIRLSQYSKYADVYGSPKRRGPKTVPLGKRPPQQQTPDGRRFTIEGGRRVSYLGWSFDLYFRTVSGLQLFNVKFAGVDVAFEVGMQTIAVLYGASEPENLFRSYYDDGFVLGSLTYPLLRGVDCPIDAVYVDSVIYSPGSDSAQILRDGACIFEHVNSIPARRHYDDAQQFSMPDAVLIVRQVLTVSNYDYIVDYEFHQTGVIEAKVSPTGYAAVTNDREQRYGYLFNREQQVNGNIHVHAFNFKFDVDVTSAKNRLVSIDLESEETSNPLCQRSWQQLKLREYLINTEKQAISHYNLPNPKYYVLQSAAKNTQGYRKGYRVLSTNFVPLPLADKSPFVNAASWMRYGLAVTVRKDGEPTTASLYTQGDPFNPPVDFERFIADDENIVDRDLVVWATVVMHHFPSAEDIPVTTTPGKTLRVVLAPFNFFDEDPSISSDDAAITYIRNATAGGNGTRKC